MHNLIALLLDSAVFIGVAWLAWRAMGRSIPIAVIPIIIGLLLAASGWPVKAWGLPSAWGDQIGWLGVLLLAFTAGLETRQFRYHGGEAGTPSRYRASPMRLASSAGVALLLPFAAGAVMAYAYFLGLDGWTAPHADRATGALAIGLCIAVSALPVLIGIVRELGPLNRPLSQLAVGIAVIDDAVLWIGLALLLLFAAPGAAELHGSWQQVLALGLPCVLVGVSLLAQRRAWQLPTGVIYLLLPLYLAAGAWSSSHLGLHALLGAYFAGAMVPPAWVRKVPVERLGTLALMGLAPLFFGHSGLKIDGQVLGWESLQASLLLLVLSVAAKMAAVLIHPPVPHFNRRETLAVGALLQCKGLMEIVAATILRDKGLLSEHAFAALVTLAVLSTLLTGPLFRALVRHSAAAAKGLERS
jgi:Kef-type K+ transport system membrane component KefB